MRGADHRSEDSEARSREPNLRIVRLPMRASEMSRNRSLPFLVTAPLGSTIVGSGCLGSKASEAPWKK